MHPAPESVLFCVCNTFKIITIRRFLSLRTLPLVLWVYLAFRVRFFKIRPIVFEFINYEQYKYLPFYNIKITHRFLLKSTFIQFKYYFFPLAITFRKYDVSMRIIYKFNGTDSMKCNIRATLVINTRKYGANP